MTRLEKKSTKGEANSAVRVLLLGLLLGSSSESPAAASSWCSCLPAISSADCGGDGDCLNAMSQVAEAERMLAQECLPDSECRATLAEICSQVCAAIRDIDLQTGGETATPAPEPAPVVRRPPAREPAGMGKDSDKGKAREPATAEEKAKAEEDSKAEKVKAEECKSLIAYRNGGLYRDWALQETKFQLAKEASASVRELRDEINSLNWWTLSALPEIALAVKTSCDIVQTAIAAVSPGGSAVKLAQNLGETSAKSVRIYNWIKVGKQIDSIVRDSSDELVYALVLDNLGAVGATIGGIEDVVKDIQRAKSIGQEKDSYRQTLLEQTARLESQLRRYEAAMERAVRSQEIINATKEGIDRYCRKAPDQESLPVRLP
jgi:hypothetical protein